MFPDWKVGDQVTKGFGDVHQVLWTDSDKGSLPDMVEVVCIFPSKDNVRCQRGDRERNTVWAFDLVRRKETPPEYIQVARLSA